MIRTKPAPAGFATGVTGSIRIWIEQERMQRGSSASMTKQAGWGCLEAACMGVAAVGDADPRVSVLHAATVAVFGGGPWQPGPEQKAVLEIVTTTDYQRQDPPTPDQFLNALAGAAHLDYARARDAEVARIKRTPDAQPHVQEHIDHWQGRAKSAEESYRDLQDRFELLRQTHANSSQEARRLRTLIRDAGQTPSAPTPEPVADERPKQYAGVGRHGSGWRYYFKRHGKQEGKAGFATPEEAARARKEAMDALDAEPALMNVGPVSNQPQPDDDREFDDRLA